MVQSAETMNVAEERVLNIPNALTMSRLVLAIIFFILLATPDPWFKTCFFLFFIAASTDWLDGYLARKRGETTVLGRILDPFVDKVIVLGAFISLMPFEGAGLEAWMVTLIVARELLVTGLRSFLEGESVAFGADWAGKIKMVVQCFAVSGILTWLGFVTQDEPVEWGQTLTQIMGTLKTLLIWASVAITAYSGVAYSVRAAKLLIKR